jgi:predicted 3-demethylubiquinone-9 3-methyltransferase (glyoxalase superfamily)
MATITPFLWFDGRADEALSFYSNVFPDTVVLKRLTDSADNLLSVVVRLNGQELILFNGGAPFDFGEALSLFIRCESQEEIDRYWELLSAGGEEELCGWLRDRFGVTWQVAPAELGDWLSDPDAERAARVTEALMQMRKIEISPLIQAREALLHGA